jgi:hypothetical protein
VTDEELTEIVLDSLRRLKERKLAYLRSAGRIFVVGTLAEAGADLIKSSFTTPVLRRVMEEFGDST